MKRLMIVLTALAMIASFLPKVYAGETASLNLQVTFAPIVPPEPLRIWSEPAGPFTVKAGETLEFKVIAADKDTKGSVYFKDITLPEGAEFIEDPHILVIPLESISGTFKWTPKVIPVPIDGEGGIYIATFTAANTEGETAKLEVEIGVIPPPPIISIELNEANWILEGVKLGEVRKDLGPDGQPIHKIKNTGNIPVVVDIGYVLPEAVHSYMVLPGLEQGLNTFITIIGDTVLPPDHRITLNRSIDPGMEEPLPLTYGAPTALREGVTDMSMQYEIRAYGLEPAPLGDPIGG